MKQTYEIDGANFRDLQGFFEEVSQKLIPGANWGRNMDAFNDILYGGFGTPDKGFILVWKNHELSKSHLGHAETARSWKTVKPYDKSAAEDLAEKVAMAEQGKGPTLFEDIVDLIRSGHADIDLRLE